MSRPGKLRLLLETREEEPLGGSRPLLSVPLSTLHEHLNKQTNADYHITSFSSLGGGINDNTPPNPSEIGFVVRSGSTMPSGPRYSDRKRLAGRCSHANSPDVRESAGVSRALPASVTSGRRCASIMLLRAREPRYRRARQCGRCPFNAGIDRC